jgi:hypothetical protein
VAAVDTDDLHPLEDRLTLPAPAGSVGHVFTRLNEMAIAAGLVKTRPTLPVHADCCTFV